MIELMKKLAKVFVQSFHGDLGKISEKYSPMRSTTIRSKIFVGLHFSRKIAPNLRFWGVLFSSWMTTFFRLATFLDCARDGDIYIFDRQR